MVLTMIISTMLIKGFPIETKETDAIRFKEMVMVEETKTPKPMQTNISLAR